MILSSQVWINSFNTIQSDTENFTFKRFILTSEIPSKLKRTPIISRLSENIFVRANSCSGYLSERPLKASHTIRYMLDCPS